MLNFITTNGRTIKMKKLKYKQYLCSYGSIILYEDETVEFIPMLSVDLDEKLYGSEDDDLDFDNNEGCELVAEDEAEFEEE